MDFTLTCLPRPGIPDVYDVRFNGLRIGKIRRTVYGWYYLPIAGRMIPHARHPTREACFAAVQEMFNLANEG